jgi:hypothetical protein
MGTLREPRTMNTVVLKQIAAVPKANGDPMLYGLDDQGVVWRSDNPARGEWQIVPMKAKA